MKFFQRIHDGFSFLSLHGFEVTFLGFLTREADFAQDDRFHPLVEQEISILDLFFVTVRIAPNEIAPPKIILILK